MKLKHLKGQKLGKLTVVKHTRTGKYLFLECSCNKPTCPKTIKITRKLFNKRTITTCDHLQELETRKNGISDNVLNEADFEGLELAPEDRFYLSYAKGAKTRNIAFSLTLNEFKEIIKKPCHYCGISHTRRGKNLKANGVDRVENTRGYHASNCVPCCGNCNMAKRSKTVQQFLGWAKRLADFQWTNPPKTEDKGPPFEPTHVYIGGVLYAIQKSDT